MLVSMCNSCYKGMGVLGTLIMCSCYNMLIYYIIGLVTSFAVFPELNQNQTHASSIGPVLITPLILAHFWYILAWLQGQHSAAKLA